jgi:hypothetical protein
LDLCPAVDEVLFTTGKLVYDVKLDGVLDTPTEALRGFVVLLSPAFGFLQMIAASAEAEGRASAVGVLRDGVAFIVSVQAC